MRTTLFAVAGTILLGSAAAFAEPQPEAKKALDDMVAAITKAKSVAFHAEVRGVGGVFEMLPTIKADMIAARVEGSSTGWRMRVTGKSEGTGTEPTEVLCVVDGPKRTWVDYPAKIVMERLQPDLGPVGQAVNSVAVREIFEDQPLSKERTAQDMKLETAVELDGVKCDVVFVDPGKDMTKARYFIATTDHMPRKVEMIVQGGGIDGKRVWTATKFKVDQEPPAGTFAISTPDGFSFNPAASPTPVPPPVTKVERPVGPNINDQAPDFELGMPGGEKVRLSSLRGSVVVLDFWGTWHLPCRKTTAEVQKIADAFKGKPVKVFGLSVREASEAAPVKFFKDNNLNYTLLLKGDESAKAYRVKKYPTLFVIGKEGEVVYSAAGYDDKSMQEIMDQIDRAVRDGRQRPEGLPNLDPRTKGVPGSDADGGK